MQAPYSSPGLERLLHTYPLYYGDADRLLAAAGAGTFESIHVQYHSCVWTQEQVSSGNDDQNNNNENNNVDENDYWYLGSMPRESPAVALSVYGIPVQGHHRGHSGRTASACHRKTFLNTFLVHPMRRMMGNNNGEGGENDDGLANYVDGGICNEEEGQGMGCSSQGTFVWQEFSLDWNGNAVCDARHTLTVLDTMDSFNDKLQEDLECAQVFAANDDDGASTDTLYSLLQGAAVCSFEDRVCPDPFGVLQDYHTLALGQMTARDTTLASNLILGAVCLLLGSIGVVAWELLVNGGPTKTLILPHEEATTTQRRSGSKTSRGKRRRRRRPQKSSRRRVWHWLLPRDPEVCCVDDPDDLPSVISSKASQDNSDYTFELPRVDASPTPPEGQDVLDNDIPPIVPRFVPPTLSSKTKQTEVVPNDAIEMVTEKRTPPEDDSPRRGRSPTGEREKRKWFRTKSPMARLRDHQLLAAAVTTASQAKKQAKEKANEHRDDTTTKELPANSDSNIASTEGSEVAKENGTSMAQALGSLMVKVMEPTRDDDSAPSDEHSSDGEGGTPVAAPDNSNDSPKSDIAIPKIHVKMTEPGSSVSIVETIAEQKKEQPQDSRIGFLRSIVEKRNTSGPSEPPAKDPPGFLKRVPTLEKQATKEDKGVIEEPRIILDSIKEAISSPDQSESEKQDKPIPETNEAKKYSAQMPTLNSQTPQNKEPHLGSKGEPTKIASPALKAPEADSQREKKQETSKKSFLNLFFRRANTKS